MVGMSDKLNEPKSKDVVVNLGRFLIESKAEDVQILDISARSGFADYFVLATVNSFGQLRGLVKNVDDELMNQGIHAKGARKSLAEDETWVLLDSGDFIVHIMTRPAREFYALERLWFDCPRIDPSTGAVLA